MKCATVFITFVATLIHFELTQFAFPEECSDLLSKTCVQSSPFVQDYLRHFLRSFQYSQSLFILTDCINNLNSIRPDFTSITVTPVAIIVNITMLEVVGFTIFDRLKPVIVLDLHESVLEHATETIYKMYQRQLAHKFRTKWQPTIFIIWKLPKTLEEQAILLQNTFETAKFEFNTRIFVYFVKDEISLSPSSYLVDVWEMYSIKLGPIFTHVSSFCIRDLTETGSFYLATMSTDGDLESFAKRRRNFHQEPLSVSVKFNSNYEDDWVGLKVSKDGTYTITSGYVAFLYWDLKVLMNFSDNILLGDAPFSFPNGTLGGITVRQLLSDEIDLTLNQISFSVQRARALNFLQPTYYSLTYAFFKQPSTSSIRNMVVAAFQKELWIALIGAWAILVISTKVRLSLLYENETFPSSSSIITTQKADKKFASESMLWSVAAFCQKAWHLDPLSISLRMKFLVGSFFGFLTYTAYSGSIVSSLAVNKIPVKNFFDLLNFNFLFTVHEQSEPFQTMLKGMIKSYALSQDVKTTSTIKEVSHLFTGFSNIQNPPSSMLVQSAKVAFLSPADMFFRTAEFLNYSDSFICNHVTSLSIGGYPSKSAMLVNKGSQFKEVLNFMLIHLRQRGLISRNILRYNTQNFLKCIPMDEQDSRIEPATWTDVFTIFILLFIGFFSAVLLFSLEIAYVCYSDRKRTLSIVHSGNHYLVGYDTIDSYYVV